MSAEAARANEQIKLTGKNVAVAGGTQGIGRATGERFAKAGASVWVIGRNEQLGQEVVNSLKGKGAPHAEFIKADLSLISSMHKVAEEIKAKTDGRVDFLITTQGGPPNGSFSITSEGHEKDFTVQVVSRFALAYLLAESGTLKDTWLSVMAPGGAKAAPPDLDDLELKSEKERNKWLVSRMIATGTRDGAVIDGVSAHFATAYPHLRAAHVFPGLVITNAAANRGFPRPLVWLQSLFAPVLSRTIGSTPEGYAEIPFYVAANPEARGKGLEFSKAPLKPIGAPAWTRENPELRQKLWNQMRQMVDERK
ncbi:hypothetical protein OIV83_001060 [Microbotryomycetes sp. JL201]|nr:hypothetical protein OIV83_001060 [Microbotryomycetes sp. JL201]